jgi:hypothetical protein
MFAMKNVLTVVCLVLAGVLFAQDKGNAVIKGKIYEESTGEALLSAQLELIPTEKKTLTDFDGNYEFIGLNAGTYSLKIFSAEFPIRILEGIELKAGQILEINYGMAQDD